MYPDGRKIYLLTPWRRALLEKLTGSQPVNKFPTFMETQSSLHHSQMSANCSHPEPQQSRPCPQHPTTCKIHLNIILPSTPGSSEWSLSLRFPHQSPVYTSVLLHTCYKHLQNQKQGYVLKIMADDCSIYIICLCLLYEML